MPFPRSGTFRSGTFRSGTFHSGSFRPGSFRPDAFPPRRLSAPALSVPAFSVPALSVPARSAPALFRPGFLFCCGPFVPRVCRFPGGCSSEREGARQDGRSLGRYGKGGRSVGRREGPVGKREARSSEKGRPFGRKEPRQVRDGAAGGGGHPAAGTALRGEFPAKRVPAGPEWRPDNTNRIKNTRFGLPFNEKFGMFVHMNRIRLAEVTLIGHATGSLSGTCAGRGTGGENIWCFMSPAR